MDSVAIFEALRSGIDIRYDMDQKVYWYTYNGNESGPYEHINDAAYAGMAEKEAEYYVQMSG